MQHLFCTLERAAPGAGDTRRLKLDPEVVKFAAQLQWAGGEAAVNLVRGKGNWYKGRENLQLRCVARLRVLSRASLAMVLPHPTLLRRSPSRRHQCLMPTLARTAPGAQVRGCERRLPARHQHHAAPGTARGLPDF